MNKWMLLGLLELTAAVAAARLIFLYSHVPAVWRGAAPPKTNSRMLDVLPRSYVTFVLYVTSLHGFFICLGAQVAVAAAGSKSHGPFAVGVGAMMVLSPAIALLHWWVNSFNRPRFLVPPHHRSEPGRLAERRTRRRRKAAGLAPTDHLVEIDAVGDDPFLVAVCTVAGCGWLEYEDERALNKEQALRNKIAKHTGRAPELVLIQPVER